MNTYVVFIALAIVICDYYATVNAYRKFEVAGTTTILSLVNETVRIQCVTDVQMAYCGFIHPTGKRYSFSGQELIDGHCSIEIRATHADSGAWTCHYIGKKRVGVEVEQTILLRVVGQVAAIQPSINVVHGKQVTLSCATTEDAVPLNYCRFEPPKGAPFSIGPEVKRENAILGKYFFPKNRSLDRGDCAVTIAAAKYEDVGLWTCGAGLLNDEHTDVIKLDVQGLYTMSASVTGVTFGTIGIATFLCVLGFMAWKKRHLLGRGRVREEIELAEAIPERSSVHGSTRSVGGSAAGTPRGSPRGSHRRSVSVSPVMARVVPTLVVQSPSEPTSSPKAS